MTAEATGEATTILESLKHSAGSDIGMRREENQDSFGIIENPSLKFYFVADGMGGVKGGAVASQLAVRTIKECLESRLGVGLSDILAAVHNANHEIFEKGVNDSQLAGMGTTLVGILFSAEGMYVVNVGDSRAYRIRQNKVTQLTEDHTLVMELLKTGAITADQVENHPVSHMLTRSLGPTPIIEADCYIANDGPARGDIYLLCSDGLYNLVQPADFLRVLAENDLDSAVTELIRLANERGGTDNITVILVRVDDSYPVGPELFSEPVHASIEDTVELFIQPNEVEGGERQEPEQVQNGADSNGAGNYSAQEPQQHNPELEPHVDFGAIKQQSDDSKIYSAEAVKESVTEAVTRVKGVRPQFYFVAGIVFSAVLVFVAYLAAGNKSADQGPTLPNLKSASNTREVSAPTTTVGRLVDLAVQGSTSENIQPVTMALLPELSRNTFDGSDEQTNTAKQHASYLTKDESESISKRLEEVKDYITKLEAKIAAFDKPYNGRSGEALKQTQKEMDGYKKQLEDSRAQIEVATRKLSIWYGRRKRLESTDPINLATEVSVSSPNVKEKREIFERASWDYLKEHEVLRYNPSDLAQEQKVTELARIRKNRMKELVEEVRNTVDSEISLADKEIAELTAERETIQSKIDGLKREVEYQQILLGSDDTARQRKKDELVEELGARKSELDELVHLLGESQPKAVEAASAAQ